MAQRVWLALMPMLLWSLVGCVTTEQAMPTSFMRRLHNNALTPDLALIKVALIEQPPGDEYINHQLWRHTDEMIVDLDHRTVLEENGLRVGQLVGASPVGFQQLLLSERATKTNFLVFPAGQAKTIFVSPANLPDAAYTLVHGKRNETINLTDAKFGIDVAARFAPDGRTTFTFTPKVEYGELAFPFYADRLGFAMKLERPARVHPELSWEVTLGPDQTLILGARPERDGSLGQATFLERSGDTAVQRLLVIRNVRSADAREAYENNVEELVRQDRAMPLALQAMMPGKAAAKNR